MVKGRPLLLALAAVLAASAVRAEQGGLDNLRDRRYCEIILGADGSRLPRAVEVYNTTGLNDCPASNWSKISVSAVKAETKANFVLLNGPRRWTIDAFVNSQLLNPTARSFLGLDMRLAGVLHLSVSDFLSRGPYRVHTVDRKTTFLFKAGLPVFELVDPAGAVYVMQSYSLEVDPGQTIESLPRLGERLRLPPKWAFRVVTLKKDYRLEAVGGEATVVQDELRDTYQRSAAKAGDAL